MHRASILLVSIIFIQLSTDPYLGIHWYCKSGIVNYYPGNQHHRYSEEGLCKFSNVFEHHRHMWHCICPRPPILTIHHLLRKKMWEWVDNFTRNTRAIVCKKQVIIIVFHCLCPLWLSLLMALTCSNVLYLDIHLCYKIGTGSYPLGNPLHPFAGEGWCKYACDVALHCRSLGYSLPRVPNLTNCHLLRKKRKKS